MTVLAYPHSTTKTVAELKKARWRYVHSIYEAELEEFPQHIRSHYYRGYIAGLSAYPKTKWSIVKDGGIYHIFYKQATA